jgi:hypothetical protein
MYTSDNNDLFPVVAGWADWGGIPTNNIVGPASHGGTNRLVNRYVPNFETYRCPADKGDPLYNNVGSCYWAWGNSYLIPWGVERYRVQHVTGDSLAGTYTPMYQPIKASRVSLKPTTKLLFGDWVWFADRNISNPQSAWHNDRGKPFFPLLWGDLHVANFLFPAGYAAWSNDGPQQWDPSVPLEAAIRAGLYW